MFIRGIIRTRIALVLVAGHVAFVAHDRAVLASIQHLERTLDIRHFPSLGIAR